MELESKLFFDNFKPTDIVTDPLPLKVLSYTIETREVGGQALYWAFQYLYQKNCPSNLLSPILKRVFDVVSDADLTSCAVQGLTESDPNTEQSMEFQPLKLMQAVTGKIDEVCLELKALSASTSPDAGSDALDGKPLVHDISFCTMKNTRRSLEDRMIILPNLDKIYDSKRPASYFAIFDGHNGVEAAAYAAAQLHQNLINCEDYPTDINLAIQKAFKRTDTNFLEKCTKDNIKSGATAVLALISEAHIHIAWAGDSQAVLVKKSETVSLVSPHKPEREDEMERIRAEGGDVLLLSGTWRVNGNLAVSRAIGDYDYKSYIISDPDIRVVNRDENDEFLILACDGLWDDISPLRSAQIVRKFLAKNGRDLEGLSQALASEAKKEGCGDNITIIVVFLQPIAQLIELYRLEEQQGDVIQLDANAPDTDCHVASDDDWTFQKSYDGITAPLLNSNPFQNELLDVANPVPPNDFHQTFAENVITETEAYKDSGASYGVAPLLDSNPFQNQFSDFAEIANTVPENFHPFEENNILDSEAYRERVVSFATETPDVTDPTDADNTLTEVMNLDNDEDWTFQKTYTDGVSSGVDNGKGLPVGLDDYTPQSEPEKQVNAEPIVMGKEDLFVSAVTEALSSVNINESPHEVEMSLQKSEEIDLLNADPGGVFSSDLQSKFVQKDEKMVTEPLAASKDEKAVKSENLVFESVQGNDMFSGIGLNHQNVQSGVAAAPLMSIDSSLKESPSLIEHLQMDNPNVVSNPVLLNGLGQQNIITEPVLVKSKAEEIVALPPTIGNVEKTTKAATNEKIKQGTKSLDTKKVATGAIGGVKSPGASGTGTTLTTKRPLKSANAVGLKGASSPPAAIPAKTNAPPGAAKAGPPKPIASKPTLTSPRVASKTLTSTPKPAAPAVSKTAVTSSSTAAKSRLLEKKPTVATAKTTEAVPKVRSAVVAATRPPVKPTLRRDPVVDAAKKESRTVKVDSSTATKAVAQPRPAQPLPTRTKLTQPLTTKLAVPKTKPTGPVTTVSVSSTSNRVAATSTTSKVTVRKEVNVKSSATTAIEKKPLKLDVAKSGAPTVKKTVPKSIIEGKKMAGTTEKLPVSRPNSTKLAKDPKLASKVSPTKKDIIKSVEKANGKEENVTSPETATPNGDMGHNTQATNNVESVSHVEATLPNGNGHAKDIIDFTGSPVEGTSPAFTNGTSVPEDTLKVHGTVESINLVEF